jgi:hypothetical protein
MAEAVRQNSTLQEINLGINNLGLELQIADMLEDNRLKKERNYRKFISAFTKGRKDLIRLPFDKMMLRFVFYPILGVCADEKPK